MFADEQWRKCWPVSSCRTPWNLQRDWKSLTWICPYQVWIRRFWEIKCAWVTCKPTKYWNKRFLFQKTTVNRYSLVLVIVKIFFWSDRKNLSQSGHDVRKGRLVNIVMAGFYTIAGHMTEMPQQKNCSLVSFRWDVDDSNWSFLRLSFHSVHQEIGEEKRTEVVDDRHPIVSVSCFSSQGKNSWAPHRKAIDFQWN